MQCCLQATTGLLGKLACNHNSQLHDGRNKVHNQQLQYMHAKYNTITSCQPGTSLQNLPCTKSCSQACNSGSPHCSYSALQLHLHHLHNKMGCSCTSPNMSAADSPSMQPGPYNFAPPQYVGGLSSSSFLLTSSTPTTMKATLKLALISLSSDSANSCSKPQCLQE
jgi:hypothetical protein